MGAQMEIACWKTPRGVRTAWTTWPEPPQVPQVDADVPALMPEPVHAPHASSRLTSISLLQHQTNVAPASAQREQQHFISTRKAW